jgi:hypothetical protein
MGYRLKRRDGSVVHAMRNPDGSWVEMPAPSDQPSATSASAPESGATAATYAPGSIREFLREIGRRGGKARAARHSRDEIAAWGRVRHKNAPRG